jgi:hypothetical protein
VAFDHDAAFRASWSADEVLRALDDVADARVRLANDILCSCSGPYADSLRADVDGATRAVEWLAEQVRSIRSRIATARDEAFVAQVRVEVRRASAAREAQVTSDAQEAEAALARAASARVPTAGAAPVAGHPGAGAGG